MGGVYYNAEQAQARMEDRAEAKNGLVVALIAAQRAFAPALKTAVNPHFKSKFVNLGGVIDACQVALWENGLTIVQTTGIHSSGTPVLVTRLEHVSGECRVGEYPLVPTKGGDPQALGACVTYARRYALMAMLGMAPEDDDGNAASDRQGPKLAPRPYDSLTGSGRVITAPKAPTAPLSPSAPSVAPSAPPAANATDAKADQIRGLVASMGWAAPHATNFLNKTFGVGTLSNLSDAQKDECILLLTARAAAESTFPGAK